MFIRISRQGNHSRQTWISPWETLSSIKVITTSLNFWIQLAIIMPNCPVDKWDKSTTVFKNLLRQLAKLFRRALPLSQLESSSVKTRICNLSHRSKGHFHTAFLKAMAEMTYLWIIGTTIVLVWNLISSRDYKPSFPNFSRRDSRTIISRSSHWIQPKMQLLNRRNLIFIFRGQ